MVGLVGGSVQNATRGGGLQTQLRLVHTFEGTHHDRRGYPCLV